MNSTGFQVLHYKVGLENMSTLPLQIFLPARKYKCISSTGGY